MPDVTVEKLGGASVTVHLPEGADVGDALAGANIAVDAGHQVRLNANGCSDETVVRNGDQILVIPKMAGA